MTIEQTKYSLAGIHLPTNKNLLLKLNFISKICSIIVLTISVINFFLVFWNSNADFFKFLMNPVEALFFIPMSIAILMQHKKVSNQSLPFWQKFFTIVIAVITIIICIYTSLKLDLIYDLPFMLSDQIGVYSSIEFILLSLTMLLYVVDFKSINHFRTGQLIAALISVISILSLLQNIYSNLSFNSSAFHLLSLSAALNFLLLSLSLLLVKANRGFMSVFTADSISSKHAWTFLVTSIFVFPALGYLFLLGASANVFDFSTGMALMTTAIILLMSVLIWINITIYYKLELESYLIKEELRVRNIKLVVNSENLGGKIEELQQHKEKVIELLNHEQNLKEVIEQLG